MVAGQPDLDHPGEGTALCVVVLGSDDVLTSRVRRIGDRNLHVSPARSGTGGAARVAPGDHLEVSWQAGDGFRCVPAVLVDVAGDGLWQVRVTGQATRIQRRDAVRAPLGLPVKIVHAGAELAGSTIDLSEAGLRAVLRPHGDLGSAIAFPRRGAAVELVLDLYSDQLRTRARFVHRRPRGDHLHEWALTFTELPETAQDGIRAHVFTALRHARSRGLLS